MFLAVGPLAVYPFEATFPPMLLPNALHFTHLLQGLSEGLCESLFIDFAASLASRLFLSSSARCVLQFRLQFLLLGRHALLQPPC